MNFTGRAALITGGGTGLGREIALQFAAEGAMIGIAYSKSQSEAQDTVSLITDAGGVAAAFQADLNYPEEAKRLVDATSSHFGRLDIVIHNAGTTEFIPFTDLDAVTAEIWDRLFAVNTRSAFFLAQAAAPQLKAAGGGQILFTASVAGISPGGSSLPYSVSKAALVHLTKCLAVALAPDVRVNCVAPGLLMTRWVAGFDAARLDAMKDAALLQKATDLEDVAAAFLMLANNTSMTGQVVVVDSGLMR